MTVRHARPRLAILAVMALTMLMLPTAALPEPGATTEDLQLPGFDGYLLPARIEAPAGPVDRVVVLIHGSGPADLDHDLAAVTEDGQANPFFAHVAQALLAEGFAVLRYHKRTFQFSQDAADDPDFLDGPRVTAFKDEPLQQLIADAHAMVGHARQRFPDAEVLVLGLSQGTFIALQVLHDDPEVAGVILIGFHLTSLDTLIYEQTVHRPLLAYAEMDTDGDGLLAPEEMANGGPIGGQLLVQLGRLDRDGDGRYSRDEFMAANLSNLVLRDILGTAYRAHEASLPRPAEILAATDVPVLFFQGLWDNQTPAFHAQAVEVCNDLVWQKPNLDFHYFPERGHILDPRERYDDTVYRPADPAALAELARTARAFLDAAGSAPGDNN